MDNPKASPEAIISWEVPLLRIELIPGDDTPTVMLGVLGYALEAWDLTHRYDEVAELARSLVIPLLRGAVTFQVCWGGRGRIWLQVFVPEGTPIGEVAVSHISESVADGTVFSTYINPGPGQEQ